MKTEQEFERRNQEESRLAFSGRVELGESSGPSYEAEAINLSLSGMQLRTHYLPELGQLLSCKFVCNELVLFCEGEVIWRQEQTFGGEFGLRFTNMPEGDAKKLSALFSPLPVKKMEGSTLASEEGTRVRLHIEGLQNPLRARIRQTDQNMYTASSDLNFLTLGKSCEVEEAGVESRQSGVIEAVNIQIDPQTSIPQLMIALHYETDVTSEEAVNVNTAQTDDLAYSGASFVDSAEIPSAKMSSRPLKDLSASEETPFESKSSDFFVEETSNTGSKFGKWIAPLHQFALQAKPGFLSFKTRLWDRVKGNLPKLTDNDSENMPEAEDEAFTTPRRITAPAPLGGLHASGRKIIRDEVTSHVEEEERFDFTQKPFVFKATQFAKNNKRHIALGAAASLALLLAVLAFSKPEPAPALATLPESNGMPSAGQPGTLQAAPNPQEEAPQAQIPSAVGAALGAQGAQGQAPLQEAPIGALPGSLGSPLDQKMDPALLAGASDLKEPLESEPKEIRSSEKPTAAPKHVKPFGRGTVTNGKTLSLRMDNPIEKIQGTSTPMGFTIALPHVKSLEGAATFAKRDSRVESAHVQNTSHGAELTVNFKNGVPSYLVKAKGSTLELVLGSQSVSTTSKTKTLTNVSAKKRVKTK